LSALGLIIMKTVPYKQSFLLIFLGILLCTRPAIGLEIPVLSARVNDNAAMLSQATVQQLENMLTNLEQEESTQIAVLTITSLDGTNLEEFSMKVVESWKIGQKELDNGALLLIAKNDRKIRIEVGYGLEGSLTDLTAGRIIDNIITPQFRNGNFNQGVIAGVSAMISAVHGEFIAQDYSSTKNKDSGKLSGFFLFLGVMLINLGNVFYKHRVVASIIGGIIAPLIGWLFWGPHLFVIILLIPVGLLVGFLASLLLGNMRTSSGSGSGGFFSGGNSGGFSSGGFSGGGGGFGGGGSSGGW